LTVYRRRRLLVAVTLGLLASALSLLGGELVARVTGTPGSAVVEAAGEPEVYVVQPGDTLWSIAERITPDDRDIRHTVDRLAASTGGAMLQPGQRVVLPSS
jgi:nucleoid-associated protein YgaU